MASIERPLNRRTSAHGGGAIAVPVGDGAAIAQHGDRPVARRHVDRDCGRSITSLIETEIIPRLMQADAIVAPAAARPTHSPDGAAVIDFAALALQVEADELLTYAERLLGQGVTVDSLLLDVISPAAKRLGAFWEADACDFVDVTMGLWRLQEVVHEVTNHKPQRRRRMPLLRALFAAMPSDQHSFGTVVIEEIFARDGWITDRLCDATEAELLDRVGCDSFDLVGLTVSCDSHTAAVPAMLTAIRAASHNPDIRVMLGGRVFVDDPALALRLGADGTAPDAVAALGVAHRLVDAATAAIGR